MRRLHRAWAVCLGCTLMLLVSGRLCINAFSVTQPYILAQNSFTNTETSMITTACSVTFLLCLFGFGAPLTTVGLSVWAADFSCAERRAQSVQRFQLCYAIGGLAFSFMPGMVADLTGSYAPAYVIFALFGVFSILTVQSTYRLGSKAPI